MQRVLWQIVFATWESYPDVKWLRSGVSPVLVWQLIQTPVFGPLWRQTVYDDDGRDFWGSTTPEGIWLIFELTRFWVPTLWDQLAWGLYANKELDLLCLKSQWCGPRYSITSQDFSGKSALTPSKTGYDASVDAYKKLPIHCDLW